MSILPLPARLRRWMTEVSSSVYATPVISDLRHDGSRDIIVPTFVKYLEVLGMSPGPNTPPCWATLVRMA